MVVVPVVQHAGQQVQVGRRWGGEQVPGVQRAAVGDPVAFMEGSGARQHPGLVDQDAAGGRGGLRHRGQGLAVSRWDPSHLRSFRRKLGSATPPGVRVDIAALVR